MYRLMIENDVGETYDMTNECSDFIIESIDGLYPTMDSINLSTGGTSDGAIYNSSHIQPRNIVITAALRGDIERSRQKLYRIFPQKHQITIYFRDMYRNVKIRGYVEQPVCDPFQRLETAQISVICPNPFFEDVCSVTVETDAVAATETSPAKSVCQIPNTGETEIGFTATITVSTDDEPTLETAETQSDTPANLRAKTARLVNQEFIHIDPATETVNIFLDGVYKTPGTDYSIDYLLRNGWKDVWLYFQNGGLTNKTVTLENIELVGSNLTDIRCFYNRTDNTTLQWFAFGIKSDAVPTAADKVIIRYGGMDQVKSATEGDNHVDWWTEEQSTPGDYLLWVRYYHSVDPNLPTEVFIYKSTGGTDVSGYTNDKFVRYVYKFSMGGSTDCILSPTLPAYDADYDMIRIYRGDEQLTAAQYGFDTVTKSDSSTAVLFYLTGSLRIDEQITFEVISSKTASTDIRGYTAQQVDTGLCLVSGLTITDTTTGEKIQFNGIKFQNGDVIGISTIAENISAIAEESDWMDDGTNLLFSAYDSSVFFKLAKGMNTIEITADSNPEYISAEFTATALYGGV